MTTYTFLASDFASAGAGKTYCWVCRKSFATGDERERLVAAHEETLEHREKKVAGTNETGPAR